ncbi:MAG: hypothetical protein ACAH88_10350 [Roseimicrobium sp.]
MTDSPSRRSHATAWTLSILAGLLIYLLSVPIVISRTRTLSTRPSTSAKAGSVWTTPGWVGAYGRPWLWLYEHTVMHRILKPYWIWCSDTMGRD